MIVLGSGEFVAAVQWWFAVDWRVCPHCTPASRKALVDVPGWLAAAGGLVIALQEGTQPRC